MVSFYGDYNLTETVNIPFNTFSSDDPSASVTITNLANGDIYVHKDGVEGTPTGITVSLNLGSVNGNHLAIIDLSDTNDAGFYAVGARYQVRMEGVTVDGATLNAWIGAFSIGCTLRPATVGRTLTVSANGEANADMTFLDGTAQRATDLAEIAQYLIANSAEPLTDYLDDDCIVAKLLAIDGTVADYNDNNHSLEALRARGDAAWATATGFSTHNAADVWTAGPGFLLSSGTAQDGGNNSITLANADSSTSNWFDNAMVRTTGGTGAGQSRLITAYDGASRIALVYPNWVTNPDNTTTYETLADAPKTVYQVLSGGILSSSFAGNAINAAALAADAGTEIGAAVKTAIEAGGSSITLIKAVTDALTSAAATQLALSAGTIVDGVVEAGTLSTTQMSTDLGEATNDHYNGRIIIWTSGVLENQATDITDYVGVDGVLTFTAVTEAPSAADTFIIV